MMRKIIDFILYWLWYKWRYRKVRLILCVVYNPKDSEIIEVIKAENRKNKVRNIILDCPDPSVEYWYVYIVHKSELKLERERIKLIKKRDKANSEKAFHDST